MDWSRRPLLRARAGVEHHLCRFLQILCRLVAGFCFSTSTYAWKLTFGKQGGPSGCRERLQALQCYRGVVKRHGNHCLTSSFELAL